MRATQYFNKEYIQECKNLNPEQILQFLEDFAELHYAPDLHRSRSKLISIKIPENLLAVFRQKCKGQGVNYQTKIKELMRSWLY
jgi:predicted DNA binding CopG/RHH family protein